jgi:hypothetical protein
MSKPVGIIQEECYQYEHHGHLRAEEFSIRLFKAVTQKLKENPDGILNDARNFINKWRHDHPGSGGVTYYFNRWETLINGPLDDLLVFMVSPSQDARDMRQAAPFVGVLSNQERWDIIRNFSKEWHGRMT